MTREEEPKKKIYRYINDIGESCEYRFVNDVLEGFFVNDVNRGSRHEGEKLTPKWEEGLKEAGFIKE